jgi:hypothetical protein
MSRQNASDIRCRARALRHAARLSRRRHIIAGLIARARQLETRADMLEHGVDQPGGDDLLRAPKPPGKL